MKASKSIGSLANSQQFGQAQNGAATLGRPQPSATAVSSSLNGPTSPICRCRVTYLGSSVPHITKDGLQGIQEPLRELYPDKASLASENVGIDSWLSVWSNGILVENVDETGREVKRFFKIDALHYCAAVKYVPQVGEGQQPANSYATLPSQLATNLPKFLPLDSPHARQQSNGNPPIFASILRRTTGIKVLECHAFICKREAAANALVRCCFHAYADTMYAKQIGADVDRISSEINHNLSKGSSAHSSISNSKYRQQQQQDYDVPGEPNRSQPMATRRSKSIAALNDSANQEAWTPSESSECNDDRSQRECRGQISAVSRRKSMNEQPNNGDSGIDSNGSRHPAPGGANLQKQQSRLLSKSMHHLNQPLGFDQFGNRVDPRDFDQNGAWPQQAPPPVPSHRHPFYNPIASRVPSYPPQSLIEAANGGGTLKSIRSMAANSIASTLLRSKKHAKAMSMAQLHQQPHSNGGGLGGAAQSMVLPPVPDMFLHQAHQRPIVNGSQTMKLPSRANAIPFMGAPMNFESMTPKEMKKLLKKSAKYGLDPSKFAENGVPLLPLRGPPLQMPPPPPLHLAPHQAPGGKSGTLGSRSVYSMDMHGHDVSDLASLQSSTLMRGHPHLAPPLHPMDALHEPPPMKPILVRPNQEFLKSKAGKKWLKQQKEFKKLLPPHLDGLPIVFGPPPMDALEPANPMMPPPTFMPPPPPPSSGLPLMDAAGYYNPHPFYGPSGRASTASTLIRYSPHDQPPMSGQSDYGHQLPLYGNNPNFGAPSAGAHNGGYLDDGSSLIFGPGDVSGGFGDPHQHRRNHMVEQSVISLGDENDYDDDDEEAPETNGGQHNGAHENYYAESKCRSSRSNSKSRADRDLYQSHASQQDYERASQTADDQSSYSSGIYRKGHLNERAFSYSIRQEHRSGAEPPGDGQQPSNGGQHDIYQNARDQSEPIYYRQHGNPAQSLPVNELTARLESQLNMRSFSNSRVKSHM